VDLLEAAYALIAEKGLEGLRTRDIAARAGVNISTLHYYFATKEALLVGVVELTQERFRSTPQPRKGDPLAWTYDVRAYLEAGWRTFQAHPQLAVVLQELGTRGHRDPATKAAFRAMHVAWNKGVEDMLRAGMAKGSVRSDLDPKLAARVITSFTIGTTAQLGVNARAFDFEQVAAELERWIRPPA
jgi:AcrR family transcriptional regulator